MLVEQVMTEGWRTPVVLDTRGQTGTPNPCVALDGGAAGVAVGDALDLAFLALGGPDPDRVLTRIGFGDGPFDWTIERNRPVSVHGLDPSGVRSRVDPRVPVTITVVLRPDPPLLGVLRQAAARDPRLAAGLDPAAAVDGRSPASIGRGGALTLRVGWMFAPSADHASIDVLRIDVGEVATLPAQERPPWIDDLCRRLAPRFHRLPGHVPARAIADALLAAATDEDPVRRAAAQAARSAAAEPPFGLGSLEVVRGSGPARLAYGPDLIPSSAFGRWGDDAAALLHAVWVVAPDVLFADRPGATSPDPAALRVWLEAATDRTLEQVLHT